MLGLNWAPGLGEASGATDHHIHYPCPKIEMLLQASTVVKGGEYSLSMKHTPKKISQLNQEIETMREKLYRLVNADPGKLNSVAVYQLSTSLDKLIYKLHQMDTVKLR